MVYLSIAEFFAAIYEILLALIPGSISGVTVRGNYLVLARGLIYYSLTTLTSTGYGDLKEILAEDLKCESDSV